MFYVNFGEVSRCVPVISKCKQKKNYLKGNNSYNPTYFYLAFFIESCNGAGSRETKTKTTGAWTQDGGGCWGGAQASGRAWPPPETVWSGPEQAQSQRGIRPGRILTVKKNHSMESVFVVLGLIFRRKKFVMS